MRKLMSQMWPSRRSFVAHADTVKHLIDAYGQSNVQIVVRFPRFSADSPTGELSRFIKHVTITQKG